MFTSLRPPGFSGVTRRLPALLCGHGDHAALAAQLAAFATHSGHDAGYVRRCDFGDYTFHIGESLLAPALSRRLSIFGPGRAAHHLKGRLVYVGRLGAFA